MHIVDDPIETVHLYVVREEPKQPYAAMPLVAACLCLLAIAGLSVYSGEHPHYEHQTLTVPAQLLPPQTFTATQPIIPTGVKNYPATYAHGWLTFSNGSVIGLSIPQGLNVDGVVIDRDTYVPPGNVSAYGYALVPAHATRVGSVGNFHSLAINTVIGDALYVRNLSPFTGGHDAYSTKYATAQDKQAALLKSRQVVASFVIGYHYPCTEHVSQASAAVTITWRCQFVTFRLPASMHIITVKLSGKKFLVTVAFVAPPAPVRMK